MEVADREMSIQESFFFDEISWGLAKPSSENISLLVIPTR